MHPYFFLVFMACAAWFYWCASAAGKPLGARIGFAVVGMLEFVAVAFLVERIVRDQDFFVRALRSGPDIGPIVAYIVLPTLAVVFLTGLWLRKRPARPAPRDSER